MLNNGAERDPGQSGVPVRESDPKKMPASGVTDKRFRAARDCLLPWSSIPDDELLETAIRGNRASRQSREARWRLLDDRRPSTSQRILAGGQCLRNIDGVSPNANPFRDFDDNLRQALRQETEMPFDSVVRGSQRTHVHPVGLHVPQ
jgi:hypothetical protein